MTQSEARHIYLPWLRQGMSADVAAEDSLGAGVPGRVTMQLQLRVNDVTPTSEPDDVTVRFHGPGDVIGIDPAVILRSEPRPHYPVFEPNYFAFVEFRRPDFPWLFTPARANALGRLRPWLALVVVPRGEGVSLSAEPRRQLPILRVPRVQLPNLSDSWAWAHSQLTRPPTGTHTITQLLENYPDNSLSRLICSRRLEPSTDYLACLVPAFASGRKAGMGEPLTPDDEAQLTPAWLPLADGEDDNASTELPVYHHWEFTTGVAGDFEALVRRLEVRTLPPVVGVQDVDMHDPGWNMPTREPDEPGALMQMEGIFAPPTSRAANWDAGTRTDFVSAIRAILGGPPDVAGSPVVKPPLYGQEYARVSVVPADGDEPHWLRELNVDPRYRIAAGMGVMVIRLEQERLMEEAWKQLAAARRSLPEQRRLQFSDAVSSALRSKRLDALSAPAGSTSAMPLAASFAAIGDLASVAAVGDAASTPAGGVVAARALVSTANGSLARRLQARGQLDPDLGAPAEAGEMPEMSARAAMGAQSAAEGVSGVVEPFRFSPTFSQSTLEWLRDYFPAMLLPGLSRVPPNTITLLESNPAAIEAFMVGLNHEMGHELLWREFPVDRRATFFRNVWDDPAAADELPPIAEWTPASHLGDHLQQGFSAPPDSALEAQITAAQNQIASLRAALDELDGDLDDLDDQRQATVDAGAPQRGELLTLRSDAALIETREFERTTATESGLRFDAEADSEEAKAAEIRTEATEPLAELAELQAIAAQIPSVEQDLQNVQAQIEVLTDQIEGIPALRTRLEDQRTSTRAAISAIEQTIAETQAQVATIPGLQQQVAAAEAEAAGHRADGDHERNVAAQIRATADPARQRLRELELLGEEAVRLKERIDVLVTDLIPRKEEEISRHREQEPPPPKGGEPKALAPTIPGPVEDPWEEWNRRLEELLAELGKLNSELQESQARVADITEQLQEVPALQAIVDGAEADAAPHDTASAAAYRRAAEATERGQVVRRQIAAIDERAGRIPALEAQIDQHEATIAAITTQIDGLPNHQQQLEQQRANAQDQADAIAANITQMREQIEGIPPLQERIAEIEARAVVHDQRAAACTLWAGEERAKVPLLTAAIATLQARVATIPAVTAQVEANNSAVAAVAQQIVSATTLRGTRLTELATAERHLDQLLNERTARRSQLVLVIRGDVLRRFARARIFAVEAVWTDAGHTQRAPDPDAEPLQPLFRQTWGQDLTMLGFAMTGSTARGTGSHPGWYFVLEEPPTDARFGLDVPLGASRDVAEIAAWDTLRWDDLVDAPGDLADLRYVGPGGRLAGEERPVTSDVDGGPPASAAWGRNSAHMALITRQRPARMEVHASLWLP